MYRYSISSKTIHDLRFNTDPWPCCPRPWPYNYDDVFNNFVVLGYCRGIFIFACDGYLTVKYIFPVRRVYRLKSSKKLLHTTSIHPVNWKCLLYLLKSANDLATKFIVIYFYYLWIIHLFDIQIRSKYREMHEVFILPGD